jgi:hypothetical protein
MLELEWRELSLSARYHSDSFTEEKITTAWLEMRSLYKRMAQPMQTRNWRLLASLQRRLWGITIPKERYLYFETWVMKNPAAGDISCVSN